MDFSQIEQLAPQVDELKRREAAEWFNQWCATFLEAVRVQTGRYKHRGLHWHAFSFGLVPSLEGQPAWSAYAAMPVEPLIVVPESWQGWCGARLVGSRLPDLVSLKDDLYVFPESLVWTLALTHENSCGPYLLRRPR